ncbi:hypothetical protein H8356DRAFT_1406919 [Neocallimastix lanati (nom. inval.)]|nr:hypothetical protein H8356DRAFT_1406919 [Neocallimastix sp. JGI-2020a]
MYSLNIYKFIKNSFIPSNNYSLLEKQNKFGFRKKYVKRKFKDFLSTNFCQYSEFSYNENTKSRYKIICNSTYPCIKNKNENETTVASNSHNNFQ